MRSSFPPVPFHRSAIRLVLALALLIASSAEARPQEAQMAPMSSVPMAANPDFPLSPGLVPMVEFWEAIYSRVSKDQVLFHDRERMDVVYELVQAPEAETGPEEIANANLLAGIREHYRAILLALGEGFDPDTLSGETRRVYELWGDGTSPGTFGWAADNVRWQRGLRERFIEGLAYSGRYQPYVEEVFREEGVPLELTFLPFVESMYNARAFSSAGAAGVWQFMPSTARLFMRVDGTLDERMDPIQAARAAARLLHRNYETLGTWPLAITAYNHGPYGMLNAVRVMGTRDIEKIVKGYDSRGFGFASRNFYAEFLAALEVRRNYTQHLGDVRLDPALEFDEVQMPTSGRLSTVAQALEIPVQALWDMNPAFTPRARSEDRAVPAGHQLRLPPGSAEKWSAVLAALRGTSTVVADPPVASGGDAWYVVRRGDTLGEIAERHGVALTALRGANGLTSGQHIRPGQRLRIPR
jgi:membrane-bound lytic murein transglycosylase D